MPMPLGHLDITPLREGANLFSLILWTMDPHVDHLFSLIPNDFLQRSIALPEAEVSHVAKGESSLNMPEVTVGEEDTCIGIKIMFS